MTIPAFLCAPGRAAAAACLGALLACGADPASDLFDPGGDDGPPPLDVTYQFGALFEPPVGRIVHGVGQWEQYNPKYFALLPASAQPASELLFIDIGDTPRGWQPVELAARVAAIGAAGRIPHIDIALRGLQPFPDSLATMPDPLYGIDHDVANTGVYDGRIQDLIQIVGSYGKPVMLRIGGEFSGPWNGYHPYEYPKAFRKIVHMFRQAGVDNVAFIWCYEPAAPDDFDHVDAAGQAKWYPGDDVVDWFGLDVFALADIADLTGGGGRDGSTFARSLRFLDMAVAHARPVVIAESAPSHYDFGAATQAVSAWSQWFTSYFTLFTSRPEIKWFHYINYDWTKASHYATLGWKNNDLSASPALAQLYVAEVTKPRYLHAGEKTLLKDWGKY